MEDHNNIKTEGKSDTNQGNGGTNSGTTERSGMAASSGSASGEQKKQGNGHSAEKSGESEGTFLSIAKNTAGDAYDAVADKATTVISDQKSNFSVGLVGVADTVRRVSEAFKDGDSKNSVTEYASTYSDTAANKLEKAAEYFETSDIKGLARDVESYARRNPAIFLGAAFAAGVLVARFIKSSPPSDSLATGAAKNGMKSAGKSNGSAAVATA